MRGRLLRVLAHLKAAHHHLSAAQILLCGIYHNDSTNAVNGVLGASINARQIVSARYALVVYDHLAPAELPE